MSFISVLGGATLADTLMAVKAGRRPGGTPWVVFASALILIAAATASQPTDSVNASNRRIRVAVLQGNIEQGAKWSPDGVEHTLTVYEELSRQAVSRGAELIVFPESAVPGALNADAMLRRRFEWLARETGAAYLVGSVAVESSPGRRELQYFDSAFHIRSDGQYGERYDKSHLVPFGEYVPFQKLLGGLMHAVARGMAMEGVTPGPGPRPLELWVDSVPSDHSLGRWAARSEYSVARLN